MIKLFLTLFLFYTTLSFGASFNETKLLAEKGDSKAQIELAKHFIMLSKPQDAMKWLKLSAEQNNPEALVMLGKQYETGLLLKKNYAMAQDLYTQAAENGYWEGQYNLAKMYLNGLGILQDYVYALAWLNEAALSSKENVMFERDTLVKMMSPNQLTKAQALSKTIHDNVTNKKLKK